MKPIHVFLIGICLIALSGVANSMGFEPVFATFMGAGLISVFASAIIGSW